MSENKSDFISGIKLAHLIRLRDALVHGRYTKDNKKMLYFGRIGNDIPLDLSFLKKTKRADYRLIIYMYNYLVSENRLLNVYEIDFDPENRAFIMKTFDEEKNEEIEETISLSDDNSSPIKSERIIKRKKEQDKISIQKEIVYSTSIAIELIKLYSDEKTIRNDSSDSIIDIILRDLSYKHLWYRTINDIGVVTLISKEDSRLQKRGISSCDIASIDLSDTFDVREDDIDISKRYLNRCLELNSNKKTTTAEQLSFTRRMLAYYLALENIRLNKEISEKEEKIVECYNEKDKELEEFINTIDTPFEYKESERTK